MILPFSMVQISTGKLNTVNDPSPGQTATPAVGSLKAQLVGQITYFDHTNVPYDSSIGTLYGGSYQYVKATTALARGQFCMWDVAANNGLTDYEVTSTITLAGEGFSAGFALNTVTSGNYCWIQTGGLATVLCAASVTTTTIGNIAVQLTTTNTIDAIADATGSFIGGGAKGLKNIVGAFYDAPSNGGLVRIVMKNFCLNI